MSQLECTRPEGRRWTSSKSTQQALNETVKLDETVKFDETVSLNSCCTPHGSHELDDAVAQAAELQLRQHDWPPLDRVSYLNAKYVLERLMGCVLLIPATPLILFFGLLVKLTSKGPMLYRQDRMGLEGSVYRIIKIRTMYIDAEADGIARWCVKGDSRITPIGRFLRKLHIDELPQLINVVRGHMVLVGPRPERPVICCRLAEEIDGYYDRLAVKPGITGLAQINLPPDESDDDVRRKQILDLRYIDEANLWLDLRMLAATGLRMCGLSGDTVMRSMGLCRKSLITSSPALRTCKREPEPEDGLTPLIDVEAFFGAIASNDNSVDRCVAAIPRHPR